MKRDEVLKQLLALDKRDLEEMLGGLKESIEAMLDMAVERGMPDETIDLRDIADENGVLNVPCFVGVICKGKAYIVGTPYGKRVGSIVEDTAARENGILQVTEVVKALEVYNNRNK